MADVDKFFWHYSVPNKEQQASVQSSFDTSVEKLFGQAESLDQKTSHFRDIWLVSVPSEAVVRRDKGLQILQLPVFYQKTDKEPAPFICSSRLFRHQQLQRGINKGWYGTFDVIYISSDKIPKSFLEIGQSQEVLHLTDKIMNEEFSVLIPEIGQIRQAEPRDALKIAETLERSINGAKLISKDPLQQRKLEDLQWDLIELKKSLWNLCEGRGNPKSHKKRIANIAQQIEDKLRVAEEAKKTIRELGLNKEELLRDFRIRTLPDDRVEYVWKKSG